MRRGAGDPNGMAMVTHEHAEDEVACGRCQRWMRPRRPWPHWGKVRVAYFSMFGLALFGGPVILADGFVLIPGLMLYLLAVGPLNSLARQRPMCRACGGLLA